MQTKKKKIKLANFLSSIRVQLIISPDYHIAISFFPLYREGDFMTKSNFWTDTVKTGLKNAYQDSKHIGVFCNGIGNVQLPVITVFVSKSDALHALCMYPEKQIWGI